MAQFTAISGRKIPSEEYSEGRNFSTNISTSCTKAAITAMKRMKLRKLRSTDANWGPSQLSAPGWSTNLLRAQLMGRVKKRTKITARPRPLAVFTFFDTARYEHIPRKYAKIILSTKIDLTNKLTYSIGRRDYFS